MPVISRFYGVIVAMYYDNRPRHFHVRYGADQAKCDIRSGALIIGYIPLRARTIVEEWRKAHVDALLANWELAQEHEVLRRIEPLR